MLRQRLDIPLNRDSSVRFLPWIIGLMVYLAGLALAGTLVLNGTLARWDRSLSGTLTVQLPPAEAGKGDDALAAVLQTLRDTPGVKNAEPLGAEATTRLLEPWLGNALSADELPLPRLIDLRIDTDAPPDLAALRARLAAAAPQAVLDDHRLWLDRLASLVVSVELTALAVVVLIGAAAVLTVVFTTRAGLAVHHGVIEVLHLIGARDNYIARQFERQALELGLRGGVMGLVLTIATLALIGHAGDATALLGERVRLVPVLELRFWHWLFIALLPAAAAGIAMLTARFTVLRALARMP
ncbi:MAG TPA: FtsX-like permease family protein [Stellaceae bacterium]|nr:FtsX-like permease family protein [Stellaceae bacterium]